MPKALRELGGVPLVVHATRTLLRAGVPRIAVVVPGPFRDDFARVLGDQLGDGAGWTLVDGGTERQDSVVAGLTALGESTPPRIVLVHDAARPLVPVEVVRTVLAEVAGGARAAVPVVPVVDSVRRVDGDASTIVDRTALRAVQTPQGFDYPTLVEAHRHVAAAQQAVTDDAAACELIGVPVALVPGSRRSLKITEPADLRWGEALLDEADHLTEE